MEADREFKQKLYIRICRDSNYLMEYTDAANFAGKLIGLTGLEIWMAFGDLDTMRRIAEGTHPVCESEQYK